MYMGNVRGACIMPCLSQQCSATAVLPNHTPSARRLARHLARHLARQPWEPHVVSQQRRLLAGFFGKTMQVSNKIDFLVRICTSLRDQHKNLLVGIHEKHVPSPSPHRRENLLYPKHLPSLSHHLLFFLVLRLRLARITRRRRRTTSRGSTAFRAPVLLAHEL